MKWKELRKIGVVVARKFGGDDMISMYLDKYIRRKYQSTDNVILLTCHEIGDWFVEKYCFQKGVMNLVFHAKWLELQKPAGPIRNQKLVDMAQEFILFDDRSLDKNSSIFRNIKLKIKKSGKPCISMSYHDLRKKLKIKPPKKTYLPPYVTGRDIRGIKHEQKLEKRKLKKDTKLKELVGDADIGDLLLGIYGNNPSKKRKK